MPERDLVPCNAAGAVSHETRRMIHLKVDTLHVVLWKAKEAPFQDAD